MGDLGSEQVLCLDNGISSRIPAEPEPKMQQTQCGLCLAFCLFVVVLVYLFIMVRHT
jgi:hypothetical protein